MMRYQICLLVSSFILSSQLFAAELNPRKTTMNCLTPFPDKLNYIKQMKFIRHWGAIATRQAFSINYDVTDAVLESKKDCFTTSGWSQFSQALHQSGNLNTIRQQHFQTNVMITDVIQAKHDRINKTWTLNIPVEIAYQNEKTRITQNLDVYMLIGLQANGRLGVMQLIGKPIESTPGPIPSTKP